MEENTGIYFRKPLREDRLDGQATEVIEHIAAENSSFRSYAVDRLNKLGLNTKLDIFNNIINSAEQNYRNWTIVRLTFESFLGKKGYRFVNIIDLDPDNNTKIVALTASCSVCIIQVSFGRFVSHYIPLPDRDVAETIFDVDIEAQQQIAQGMPVFGTVYFSHTSSVQAIAVKTIEFAQIRKDIANFHDEITKVRSIVC